MMTYKGFESRFRKSFIPLMEGLGYPTISPEGCNATREEPGVVRRVSVSIRALRGIIYPNIGYRIRLDRVEELWEDHIPDLGLLDEKGHHSTINLDEWQAWPEMKERQDYDAGVNSLVLEPTEEGVEKFVILFERVLEDILFPLGRRLEDLRVLDELLSSGPPREAGRILGGGKEWTLRRLIIARLAGNPGFDRLYEEELEAMRADEATGDPYFRGYPAVMERVYRRLKETI
jgi:hypothetical protein